ncbi:helix-turn-helix domain-containing protein [Bdellovibrionota bacterium]
MKINKKDFVKAKMHTSLSPGEMVRTLREMLGLSQSELADLCGMTQSNISAIETGARQIGRERALVLARALHVHPAVILFPDYDISEVT